MGWQCRDHLAAARLAQQSPNLPLVALITPLTEQRANERAAQLREGLKQAGLIEGRNYALALRFADGDYARLPELAKELEGSKPRVYVAFAGGIAAVRLAAPNTPLVFTSIAADPIAAGWIESYARPGGTLTPCQPPAAFWTLPAIMRVNRCGLQPPPMTPAPPQPAVFPGVHSDRAAF